MKKDFRKIYRLIVFFVCSIIIFLPDNVEALDEKGDISNVCTWEITSDTLSIKSLNGDLTFLFNNNECIIDGKKLESLNVPFDDVFSDENEPLFRWMKNHPTDNLTMNVEEIQYSIGYDVFLEKISELVIRDNVNYICDDAFLGTENLKSVYILPLTIDLTNSGIGYYTDDIKSDILTIHGYKNSTAETYANENGFTFIPLDEPVTELTTSATEEVITESTTTQPVITDSVTQQSQSTVITDAASAKVNSTPKTGENNIYGITALGISAAVLSVVSSKKKRNRNN